MLQRKFLVTAALLGNTVLAGTAMGQALNPREFAAPPASYRPVVTIDEGSGYSAPLEVAARRAIEQLDAGGIMISPQGDVRAFPGMPAPQTLPPGPVTCSTAPVPVPPAKSAKPPRGPGGGMFANIGDYAIGLLDKYPPYASPWLPRALPGEAQFGSYFGGDGGWGGPGRGPALGYLTPQWFGKMKCVLDMAKKAGITATFYDEAGFPSGSANKTIPAKYYRKLLRRDETTVSPAQRYEADLGPTPPVAVVAWNTAGGQRIDLLATAKNGRIEWTAPASGYWRVQRYSIVTAQKSGAPVADYNATADFMDPEAVGWFIANSYAKVQQGLQGYFGSTIKYSFFDDVGVMNDETSWNQAIAARFQQLTGKPAALYYPALWDDIGPDTAAARVGFFRARSELLGEGLPKLITDFVRTYGVKSTGHAPGSYDLQPTNMSGDPFKFYAYTDIPTTDVLFGLGFGRGGFKLVSAVSDLRDLPETQAEVFSVTNNADGYRRTIEQYVRGINRFVRGAREAGVPIGTGAEFNRWMGRSSYLLRGGRHAADIAVLFPVESLQAFYSFNSPTNTDKLPGGDYIYRDADYQAVGEMLLSDLRHDFSFVHPESLAGDKILVRGKTLEMQNKVNREQYRTFVLPGGEVLSAAALAKVKAFWEAGGSVIATSLLPSRSAEFGKDGEVRRMIAEMFGDQPVIGEIRRNPTGGQAVFVGMPSAKILGETLERLGQTPDVSVRNVPQALPGKGVFGYTHRQRGGKDIYYFGNSSDAAVDAVVTVRGRLARPQVWNPHDGKIAPADGVTYHNAADGPVTEFRLSVPALSSRAVVAAGK